MPTHATHAIKKKAPPMVPIMDNTNPAVLNPPSNPASLDLDARTSPIIPNITEIIAE